MLKPFCAGSDARGRAKARPRVRSLRLTYRRLTLIVPGCCWLLLPAGLLLVVALLAASGCFWLFLAAPGGFWMLLAAPGYFWLLLAASWPLDVPGYSWLLLAGSLFLLRCLSGTSQILLKCISEAFQMRVRCRADACKSLADPTA